jgi:aspartyl-tRNA(Asn)/glutamyl-tRNA(Gln) amidotransferase subunit A
MAAVSSFDQIGPIGKSVADVEIIFNTIKGNDIHDGTTISEITYASKKAGKKKPIVGVPTFFMNMGGITTDVLSNFKESIERFKKLGYDVQDIELKNASQALPVYYIINFAEVSSNLSRFDGVKYGLHKDGKDGIDDYFETRGAGFGKEARRRILLGTYVLS